MTNIWQTYDKHRTSMWQAFDKHMTSYKHMTNIWPAYDKHRTSIWQAYDKNRTSFYITYIRFSGPSFSGNRTVSTARAATGGSYAHSKHNCHGQNSIQLTLSYHAFDHLITYQICLVLLLHFCPSPSDSLDFLHHTAELTWHVQTLAAAQLPRLKVAFICSQDTPKELQDWTFNFL